MPRSPPIKSKKILRKFAKGSKNRQILTGRIFYKISQVKCASKPKADFRQSPKNEENTHNDISAISSDFKVAHLFDSVPFYNEMNSSEI